MSILCQNGPVFSEVRGRKDIFGQNCLNYVLTTFFFTYKISLKVIKQFLAEARAFFAPKVTAS